MRATLVGTVAAALVGLGFAAAPVQAQVEGEEVDGGPAAPQATQLEPETRYVDDVRPGEARWYSIEAGQAQGLRATLTEYGEVEYGCCLEVKVHDPNYNQLQSENSYNNEGTSSSLSVSQEEVDETGTYYLEITLGADAANRPVEYEFDFSATGEPAPGEEPTAEESPTDEATADDDGTDDAEAASGTDSDGGSTLLWVVVALLALLVLLLLVTLVLLLLRQNKQTKQTGQEQPGVTDR